MNEAALSSRTAPEPAAIRQPKSSNDCAIQITDVSVKIGGVQILENVNATIHCAETTALIGPNGAGKTTLLAAILGLIPYKGTIRFCQIPEHGQGAPRIGYVPQTLEFDRGTPITVLDFLCLPSQRLPLWLGRSQQACRRARVFLDRIGAGHLEGRQLGRLSGGEMQRVLLAQALQGDPDIILLDEPVSGVDVAGEEIFCDLLVELQRQERFTLILVSHDLTVVTRHAQKVICLNRTVRCQGTAVEVMTPENLRSVYGAGAGLYLHPPHGVDPGPTCRCKEEDAERRSSGRETGPSEGRGGGSAL